LLIESIALKIAKTKLGQKSLIKPEQIFVFHEKPGPRVYFGLILFVMSFTSMPTIALLSFLSLKLKEPLIVAIGAPAVIILVHIIFGLGVYLAEKKSYAKDFLLSITKRFLEKCLS
jgi:hypothetical protein